ncbi:MAG: hypothetical protein ACR2QA_19145 [Solirubrobacteraceae bacterium]
MRGRRYKGIATAVFTVAFAGVLVAAGLASGGPLRGRYYDGKPTSTAGGTSLALDFQVSGNGHQVKHLFLNSVSFTCPGGAAADLLVPDDKTAPITTDNKFTITLPSKDSFSPSPANGGVVLSGSFAGGGKVGGKLVFTGSGPLAGCHKTIDWKGMVRPLVDHFAGKVTQGSHHASFSFYRTSEPHRHVTDFAAGALTLTCPGGGTAHRSFNSVYSLRVHPDAKFGGDVFFTNGEAGNINGKFQGAAHAAGKVSYSGRDDCSYHNLSWSAHRVAASVLGPLNFG